MDSDIKCGIFISEASIAQIVTTWKANEEATKQAKDGLSLQGEDERNDETQEGSGSALVASVEGALKRKLTPACVLDDCDVDDGLARPAAKAKKKAAPKASTGPVANKAKAANGATKAKVLRDKASATEELRLVIGEDLDELSCSSLINKGAVDIGKSLEKLFLDIAVEDTCVTVKFSKPDGCHDSTGQ